MIQIAADESLSLELATARAADLTVAVSEDDMRLLLDADPTISTEIVPMAFDVPTTISSDSAGRRGLFFVGGFGHTPNVDAMTWFANEIWPHIHRLAPETSFLIAGNRTPSEVLALEAIAGIEIVGFKPDLTEYFDRCRIFVAPLRYGAGVSGKIVQSMASGLPVVATSMAAAGLRLQDEEHALIADDPQEFANAVLRLMRNDALWRKLQVNGRALIEATQSMEQARKTIGALLATSARTPAGNLGD